MSKKLDTKHLSSLDRLISAECTSITRYEAVEFLMELSGLNPPRLLPLQEDATEEQIENADTITLFDLLDDIVDAAESDYDCAKYADEPPPDSVIAAKLENIKKSESLRAQAHDFLCTIDDELAKGTLRPPPGTIHAQNPSSITVKSFKEWVTGLHNTFDSNALEESHKRGRTKQREQENAIKAELLRRGYDLMQLRNPPKNGLAGTCAEIKPALLAQKGLFGSKKVYEKAWGRLIEQGEIAYAEITHPQNST